MEAGRELKAARKALKWALKQQSAAEERYRCATCIYRAKCAQLEKKKDDWDSGTAHASSI